MSVSPVTRTAIENALFAAPTFKNFQPANTRHLRAGLARVRAGTGRLTIACGPGDSTTAGTGANTGTKGQAGAYSYAWPSLLQGILNKRLAPAVNNALFGHINAGVIAYDHYDTRVSIGAGWGRGTARSIACMWTNSTTTDALAFAPAGPFDSIDVFYVRNTGYATFTVDVDGGAPLAMTDANGAASLQKLTITGVSLSTHTINVKRTGVGGALFIAGIVAYDSTNPAINIWNWSEHGSKAKTWTGSNAWSPPNSIATYAADVMIYGIGINDQDVTDVTSFKADVQTIISAQLAVGDCILAIPNPVNTAVNSQKGQDAIRQALLDLAVTNNLPVIDRTLELESYTQANTNGWMYDNKHLNKYGYSVIASLVAKALMAAAG